MHIKELRRTVLYRERLLPGPYRITSLNLKDVEMVAESKLWLT